MEKGVVAQFVTGSAVVSSRGLHDPKRSVAIAAEGGAIRNIGYLHGAEGHPDRKGGHPRSLADVISRISKRPIGS